MQTFNMVLKELVRKGTISPEEAFEHAPNKTSFENMAPQMEMS